MTDNPFLRLATDQIANPVKSRRKGVETRRARAAQAEKDLLDEAKLLKLYRRERRRQLQALLDGPFGGEVRELLQIMRTMRLSDAPPLIQHARQAVWIKALPVDHKYILLRLISRAISKVREKNGLPPFDDGVWGEPDRAFETIKKEIGAP